MVAYSCQAAFKNLFAHSTSVAQVQLNLHEYTMSHHRRTWRKYCRKLVPCKCTATLHKARRIAQSQSSITR